MTTKYVSASPRPGRRPYPLIAVTAIVAGTLITAGLRVEGAVWLAFGVAGTVLALGNRRPGVWPFWAALGLVAAVSGSHASAGFDYASAVAGVVLAVALTVATLVGVSWRVSGGSGLETAAHLGRSLVGLKSGMWRVVDGEMSGSQGGPGGTLEVADGWVVATKRRGEFARLVTAQQSPVELDHDEIPHRAVPLAESVSTGTLERALSRDAVPILSVGWQLRWRLRALADADAGPGESYPFDPYAGRQAAWGPEHLAEAVAAEASDALVEAIRSHDMATLFAPTGEARPLEAALETARRDLAAALDAWGITFLGLRAPAIALSDDVQQHLTAIWHARTERHVRALARVAEEEARRAPATGQDVPGTTTATPDASVPRQLTMPTAYEFPASEEQVGDGGGRVRPTGRAASGDEPATVDDSSPEITADLAGHLREAASAVAAARTGGRRRPAANPVSFSNFLGTLRERANEGDEVAQTVLRQVLDAMSRLEPGSAPPVEGVDESE